MIDPRKQRQIRHLLLDRRFQLKYTAMIVGLTSLISVVLGMFLTSTVRENSRMLQLEAEFNEILQAQLAEADAKLVFGLVGAFLLFNVLIAGLSVFVTHRMAGPIFVMNRYVRELGEGKLPKVRKLRRGDEFVALIETMSSTVASIEAETRAEVALLEDVLRELGPSHGSAARLSTLLDRKRTMLAGDAESY